MLARFDNANCFRTRVLSTIVCSLRGDFSASRITQVRLLLLPLQETPLETRPDLPRTGSIQRQPSIQNQTLASGAAGTAGAAAATATATAGSKAVPSAVGLGLGLPGATGAAGSMRLPLFLNATSSQSVST